MSNHLTRVKKKKNRALTLIELVVVIIIISIMAVLATPQYFRAREKGMDKKAQTILELIRAAERQFHVERGVNFPQPGGSSVTDIHAINANLSLDLKDDGDWLYNITSGVGGGASFIANLTRVGGWGFARSWWINGTMYNASCTGNCP